MAAAETQQRQLLTLVHCARATQFGRDHNFDRISTVELFQEHVPLRTYEQFWEDYWQATFPNYDGVTWPGRLHYLATTSGTTTNKEKFIPCSNEMIASNRRAALDILVHQFHCSEVFKPLDGKTFMLGGSSDLRPLGQATFAGDLSGIAAETMPIWSKPFRFPPTRLALISDWNEKLEVLASHALNERIRVLTGNANWVLLLFEKMREIMVRQGSDREAPLPYLQLLIHGGVPYPPYAERLDPWLAQSGAQRREVYAASEGFIAIADQSPTDALRFNCDIGLFFEFVPISDLRSERPTRHWVNTIERDVDYAVVLSSCAGLWSYLMGDVVRFTSIDPPRLKIVGRTAYSLSAFGEHLDGEEIDDAVTSACKTCGIPMAEYMVGPIHGNKPSESSHHLYLLETSADDPDASQRLADKIDKALSATNDSYRRRRENNIAISVPKVVLLQPGRFEKWMAQRGRLGGQNKVPRVVSDATTFGKFSNELMKG